MKAVVALASPDDFFTFVTPGFLQETIMFDSVASLQSKHCSPFEYFDFWGGVSLKVLKVWCKFTHSQLSNQKVLIAPWSGLPDFMPKMG